MREIWDATQAGDVERAREIDAKLRPAYDVMGFVTNPIPLKAALEMTGLIPSAGLRLPLVEVDAEQRATIRTALDAVGVPVGS
jgi:4-hydroxy-tetrahydrodipicolinate synthase